MREWLPCQYTCVRSGSWGQILNSYGDPRAQDPITLSTLQFENCANWVHLGICDFCDYTAEGPEAVLGNGRASLRAVKALSFADLRT